MESISSAPAWPWKESGGWLACSRLASTALALVPEPPATAALTNWMLGLFFLKSAIMASRPLASPPPVHHENTSTLSAADPPACWLSFPPPQLASRPTRANSATAATHLRFRCIVTPSTRHPTIGNHAPVDPCPSHRRRARPLDLGRSAVKDRTGPRAKRDARHVVWAGPSGPGITGHRSLASSWHPAPAWNRGWSDNGGRHEQRETSRCRCRGRRRGRLRGIKRRSALGAWLRVPGWGERARADGVAVPTQLRLGPGRP